MPGKLFFFILVAAASDLITQLDLVSDVQGLNSTLASRNITLSEFLRDDGIYSFNMSKTLDVVGYLARARLFQTNQLRSCPNLDNEVMMNKFLEWRVGASPSDVASMVIYASKIPGKVNVSLTDEEHEYYRKCVSVFIEEDVQVGPYGNFFENLICCEERFERPKSQKINFTEIDWESRLRNDQIKNRMQEYLHQDLGFMEAFIFWRLGFNYRDHRQFMEYFQGNDTFVFSAGRIEYLNK